MAYLSAFPDLFGGGSDALKPRSDGEVFFILKSRLLGSYEEIPDESRIVVVSDIHSKQNSCQLPRKEATCRLLLRMAANSAIPSRCLCIVDSGVRLVWGWIVVERRE